MIHSAPSIVSPEDAFGAAGKLCRTRAPHVHFATSFLPKRKRDAVRTLVAFCFLTSDALRTDACDPAVSGACCGPDDSLLAMYRSRIEEIYSGKIDRSPPVSQDRMVLIAMESVVSSYELPIELLNEFGEGARSDGRLLRYATWSSLERQIHRTYGAMCRMIACVLGVSHSDAPRFANELASGLALTRIISNYQAHWHRARIYFPLADLAECRCPEADLGAGGEALQRLLSFETTRARSFYRHAAERIAWLGDDGSRMMVALVIVLSWSQLKSKRSSTAGVSMRDIVTAWRLARRRAGRPLPTFL